MEQNRLSRVKDLPQQTDMIKISRPHRLAICLLLLLAWPGSASTQQQKPQPAEEPIEDVVRVNTSLVTFPVSVMDRQGRFIPDLKQDQFHVFEDGVEQQIAHFDSADKPFTVALLLDVSDSTQTKLNSIQDAALAFVDQLRPADKVFIVTFDKRIKVLCEPTNDRSVLYTAISRTSSGGGTSLYGAIDLAVNQRLNRIPGRKAIVLLTDGVDTTSESTFTYDSTLRAVSELDALIYSILYSTSADVAKVETDPLMSGMGGGMNGGSATSRGEPIAVAYERGRRFLQLLANSTGGRLFLADSVTSLRERFVKVAAELREQYSIAFYPTNRSTAKKKRELKVRVTVPNVAVKSRRSYVYAPPSQ
jgi:VWFA-related protein